MPIVWRNALNIGNDLIDADHRHLLSLINRVEELLTTDRPRHDLLEAIDQLSDYTDFHFRREEQIMLHLQYSRYDDHKKAHGRLIEQLKQATKSILTPDEEAPETTAGLPEEARDRMVDLLRHWLVEHILKEDMKLKPLLAQYGRSYSAGT